MRKANEDRPWMEGGYTFEASKGIKLTIGKGIKSMLETPSAFGRKWIETSGINLCHSIAVCAQSPPWVGNATCSNASSGWACSRNAVSGRTGNASPACGRRSRTRKPSAGSGSARADWTGADRASFGVCTLQNTISVVRLQKFLAEAGVASRRASEKIILEGRVSVNGATLMELGGKVDAAHDGVTVDG